MARVNLANHLTSLYSPRAEPVLALRIRHDDGCVWTVADDTLTLATPRQTDTFDLNITLLALSVAVVAAGYTLAYLHPDYQHVQAIVLQEGTGDQGVANGDHLLANPTPLAVLLATMGKALSQGRTAIGHALAQMVLPQAEGEWADVMGGVFGVPRWLGELDADYTARIQAEVTRARSSPVAIAANILRVTGAEVTVREPWQEIFFLSDPARPSRLSGRQHFQGAPIYEYHTAQIVASQGSVDWPAVLREARADLPAGTILLAPSTILAPVFVYGGDVDHTLATSGQHTISIVLFWLTAPWGEDDHWDDRQWQADVPTFAMGPPSTESAAE